MKTLFCSSNDKVFMFNVNADFKVINNQYYKPFATIYDYESISYGMDCGNCSDKFIFGTN